MRISDQASLADMMLGDLGRKRGRKTSILKRLSLRKRRRKVRNAKGQIVEITEVVQVPGPSAPEYLPETPALVTELAPVPQPSSAYVVPAPWPLPQVAPLAPRTANTIVPNERASVMEEPGSRARMLPNPEFRRVRAADERGVPRYDESYERGATSQDREEFDASTEEIPDPDQEGVPELAPEHVDQTETRDVYESEDQEGSGADEQEGVSFMPEDMTLDDLAEMESLGFDPFSIVAAVTGAAKKNKGIISKLLKGFKKKKKKSSSASANSVQSAALTNQAAFTQVRQEVSPPEPPPPQPPSRPKKEEEFPIVPVVIGGAALVGIVVIFSMLRR